MTKDQALSANPSPDRYMCGVVNRRNLTMTTSSANKSYLEYKDKSITSNDVHDDLDQFSL
jgi:hypothetical protein